MTAKLLQIQKLAFATDKLAVEKELGEEFLNSLFDPSFLGAVIREVSKGFVWNDYRHNISCVCEGLLVFSGIGLVRIIRQ